MKISEIISNTTKQVLNVQPNVVKQQRRVNQVVTQIAASDAQRPATELEKALATRAQFRMQKRADKNYVKQLQQQLTMATKAAK